MTSHTPPMTAPDAGHRPELDGLRGIAVAAVIFAHAGAPLPGGHLGVDMFFVLSGYLITRQILRERMLGRFSFRQFYLRRARRILPALVFVSLACIPPAWVLMKPGDLAMFGQALFALGVFAPNVLFWIQGGYFAPAAGESVLIHTWSLGVEEQFYLIFPIAALFLLRQGTRRLAMGLAAVCLLSFTAMVLMSGNDPDAAFYLLPFRMWELLAGALVALMPRAGTKGRPLAAHAGITLLAMGLALGDPHGSTALLWQVAVVAGTATVVLEGRADRGVGRWLATRPLIALGLVSYSAYLWHQPLFAFARRAQFETPPVWQMAVLCALTLVLAWLTWRLVEQPWRRPGWPVRRRAVGALAAGAIVAAGLAMHVAEGFGALRFSPDRMRLFETANASPARARCHGASVAPDSACVLGSPAAPSWAVLGDSHAVEIAFALGEAVRDRAAGVLQLSASACPPLVAPGTAPSGCADWLGKAMARLSAEPGLETVVLSWRHGIYLQGENGPGGSVLPDHTFNLGTDGSADWRRTRYWQAVEDLVARLQALGLEVIFLAPVPEIRQDMGKYTLLARGIGEDIKAHTRAYYVRRNHFVLTRMAGLGTQVVSPAESLCDRVWCYAARDGEALYFDDDHLSLAGARRVADLILRHAIPGTPPRVGATGACPELAAGMTGRSDPGCQRQAMVAGSR